MPPHPPDPPPQFPRAKELDSAHMVLAERRDQRPGDARHQHPAFQPKPAVKAGEREPPQEDDGKAAQAMGNVARHSERHGERQRRVAEDKTGKTDRERSEQQR